MKRVDSEYADELGDDDGVDARAFHDRRRESESGRKARQLCRQVSQALHWAFAECREDWLRDLTVVSVEPAPHTGRLMVTVAGPTPADATGRTVIPDRLQALGGYLRSAVVESIHRRYAPELVFRVL